MINTKNTGKNTCLRNYTWTCDLLLMKTCLHIILLKYIIVPQYIFDLLVIRLSVNYISLISRFVHQTPNTVPIYRLHKHTGWEERRLRVDIRDPIYCALPKAVHSVFKIRKQETNGTMDIQYTGVQNSSLCVQIIADSNACFGKLIFFFFFFEFG